jgi:hypothetical protein
MYVDITQCQSLVSTSYTGRVPEISDVNGFLGRCSDTGRDVGDIYSSPPTCPYAYKANTHISAQRHEGSKRPKVGRQGNGQATSERGQTTSAGHEKENIAVIRPLQY